MIDVVRGRLPIDVAERIGLGVSLDRLGDRRAKDEGVVDILVGAAQTLLTVGRRLQAPDRLVGVLKIEGILPTAVGEAVDLQKLVGKDIVEHHIA